MYPLEKLADQLQKSETLRLNYEGGAKSQATLNVNMQWVYSKSKFYTNIINMLDKDINSDRTTLNNAQESIRYLYELFPSTANALPRQIKFSSMDRFREFSPVVSANEPTLGKAGRDSDSYTTFIMYFCIFLLIVSLFISFLKGQFLDVVLTLTVDQHSFPLHHVDSQRCPQNDTQNGHDLLRLACTLTDPRLRLVVVLLHCRHLV